MGFIALPREKPNFVPIKDGVSAVKLSGDEFYLARTAQLSTNASREITQEG